jgi:hypothetical protein
MASLVADQRLASLAAESQRSRDQRSQRSEGKAGRQHHSKTYVPVPEIGSVPGAVSATHVPGSKVERAATQHAGIAALRAVVISIVLV